MVISKTGILLQRECRDGTMNSVALLVLQSGAAMSTEQAKTVIEKSIASYRRQLQRLVLREDGVVPQTCKELFWRLYKTSHVRVPPRQAPDGRQRHDGLQEAGTTTRPRREARPNNKFFGPDWKSG